jgi:hypothetical protein
MVTIVTINVTILLVGDVTCFIRVSGLSRPLPSIKTTAVEWHRRQIEHELPPTYVMAVTVLQG